MIEKADAVVIGGGIIGASVSHFLTKLGYGKVALVEKSKICGGSTQYSAAHVRQHYSNEVAIRLAVRGAAKFANAEEELGGPAGFVQQGYVLIAPPDEAQAVRDVVPVQQRFGVQTEILTPEELAHRWPEIDIQGVALACFEPTSGYADPVATVNSLVRSAERMGLETTEGCEVTDITTDGGRVTGVVTSEGSIATEVVVNACGPWGDRTGRMVGIDYPIRFSREHEAVFEAPDGFGELPVMSDVPQQLYLRHYGDGKVLVGEGWPKELEPADPENYDDGTDEAHVARMVPRLVRRVPSLAATIGTDGYGGAFVKGYSGVYDITPDWYPIVGEEEVGGFYSAFGGSGHCFKLGPAIGEALASVIAGQEPEIDISSLSGSRFAEGRTFTSVWGPGEPRVTLDPITFEVIRNALVAATDEMVLTLRRSAYSTNIKTRSDFSCAFFDAELRAVAQGFTQPVHLGSMVEQVPRAILDYGPENLEPGDVIITNEPFPSGVHLNDISLISPVHHDGALLGYVANLAHHVDVGGGAPASIGAFREVFQEGVIIPPVRVVAGGRIVRDVFDLILAQIRSKHETAGDFRAQIAANATGVRRLQGLVTRHGLDTVAGTMRELLDYTERRTRVELGALPHGVYEAEGTVDVDGYTDEPVLLKARVELTAEGVSFDLTGSDPQRRAPVNSTYAQTFSACAYAVKCLIDPDLPVNDGFYRVIGLNAPSGSVTNCTWPSPVVGGWETQTRLVDAIFRALLPALPEQLPAGTKAMMCHAGFGGVEARTNEYYCFLETFGGGYGGRFESDGPDAVQTHGQNTENAPVEETELNYPVRVTRLSLVEDSEGPGRFRGGLGLRKDFLFDRPTTFTVLADRTVAGPAGAFGGLAGKAAEYVLIRGGEERRLSAKGTVELEAGDVVSYRTCGGGGYGPPDERDRELIARDVREGKVSAARAREVYAWQA